MQTCSRPVPLQGVHGVDPADCPVHHQSAHGLYGTAPAPPGGERMAPGRHGRCHDLGVVANPQDELAVSYRLTRVGWATLITLVLLAAGWGLGRSTLFGEFRDWFDVVEAITLIDVMFFIAVGLNVFVIVQRSS